MQKRQNPGYNKKRRNAYTRERKSIILIAVEGTNKTERQYFHDFAQDKRKNVKFVRGNETDPENMVKALIRDYQGLELNSKYGDVGFCLVDTDFAQSKNAQIKAADKWARKNSVRLIVSNPCFEVWFLCHYMVPAKMYRSYEDVEADLREYLSGYTKNLPGMYDATKDLLDDAIRHAEFSRNICTEKGFKSHTVEYTPSTEVDFVVRKLREQ